MDLDKVKTSAADHIAELGMVLYHGVTRITDEGRIMMWDSRQHPDHKEFLECAEKLGIKLIVMHARALTQELLDDMKEELEDSTLSPVERRESEKRLKTLRPYIGFTSTIELSFDYNGTIYLFETHSEFMEEILSIMGDLDMAFDPSEDPNRFDDDDDDNTPPRGGFFSRN